MSSKRWPHGTLRNALVRAAGLYPWATAPVLARLVGCDPGSARVVLRSNGIDVPKEKPAKFCWTPGMRAELIDAAKKQEPVYLIAERFGVAPQTLIRGALQTIAELTE